jgi:hypothetical protein
MSYMEASGARAYIAQSGAYGTQRLIIPDDDKIVVSANMKVGAYTIAAQPVAPSIIGVLVTAVGATDTLGTITIVGTAPDGSALSETITPVAATTVKTTNAFATITSVTGAGWVIGEGNDTIKVGVVTSSPGVGKYFSAINVLTNTVVASQTNATSAVVPTLSGFTALIAGHTYPVKCTEIALTSGEAIAYVAPL